MALASGLRRRLRVLAPSRVSDGQGGWSVTWEERARLWASVRPGSATETVDGSGHRARRSWLIECGYGDLTTAMRLADDEKTMSIESVVDPDGDRERLEIDAVEVEPA